MADLSPCPECRWFEGQHHPTCSEPLRVKRFPDDTDEERRAAVALERCNAGAAEWLAARGLHPHTYAAGGARRIAA